MVYGKIIDNSVALQNLEFQTKKDNDQYIGQKADGTVIILTANGRNSNNKGINYQDAQTILIRENCVNAWALDGGGSTSTVYRGIKLNMSYDNNGIMDRQVVDCLNYKSPTYNEPSAEIENNIGMSKYILNTELRPLINNKEPKILKSRLRIVSESVNGQHTLKYNGSLPTSDFITFNSNGEISINIPNDTHKDYQHCVILIFANVSINSRVGTNENFFLELFENNTQDDFVETTINNTDTGILSITSLINTRASDYVYSLKTRHSLGAGDYDILGGTVSVLLFPNADMYQ